MAKKVGIPKMGTKTAKKKAKKTKKSAAKPTPATTVDEQVDVPISAFDKQRDQESVVSVQEAKKITSCMYWDMRGVTKSRVDDYAQLMKMGYWVPGLTISFAELNGKKYLIDGQHRLFALIKFGKPLRFNMKYYECSSREQVQTLYQIHDQGKTKTKLDTMVSAGTGKKLEISKAKLSRATSAVGLVYYKFGRVKKDLEGEAWQFARNPLMQSKILEEQWGDAIRGYFDAIEGAMKEMTRPTGNLNRNICIAVGLLTFRADAEKAFRFWKGIGRFYKLEEDDPRFTAGRYIMGTDMRREGGIPRYKHARSILSCWNAFAENRKLSRIMVIEKNTTKVFGFDYEI